MGEPGVRRPPGLAIDAITGGLYKLAPDQVMAQLQHQDVQVTAGGELLLVTVVMRPARGMERIGTLVPD